MRQLLLSAYTQVQRPKRFIFACLMAILFCVPYPSELESYRASDQDLPQPVIRLTEDYLRFTNTVVQIALPVLLKDKIGMIQLVYVGVSSTIATHGLKRLADQRVVRNVRLGERPNRPDSHHNMPSGHSSMASCAAYFVCRRYGLIHGLYLVPILILTMYARVELNAHTVSAVLAGALIGLLTSAIFTSPLTSRALPVVDRLRCRWKDRSAISSKT